MSNVERMLQKQCVNSHFMLVPKTGQRPYLSSAGKIVVRPWNGKYFIFNTLLNYCKLISIYDQLIQNRNFPFYDRAMEPCHYFFQLPSVASIIFNLPKRYCCTHFRIYERMWHHNLSDEILFSELKKLVDFVTMIYFGVI